MLSVVKKCLIFRAEIRRVVFFEEVIGRSEREVSDVAEDHFEKEEEGARGERRKLSCRDVGSMESGVCSDCTKGHGEMAMEFQLAISEVAS